MGLNFLLLFLIIGNCAQLQKHHPLSFLLLFDDEVISHCIISTLQVYLKGDLDGTILSYDCCMRFLERALLSSCKNRTQLLPLNIAFTYDCRRILKQVLKSYDIFRVVCVCRKDVVG